LLTAPRTADTTDQIEASLIEALLEATEAALLAAFATDNALLAALLTMLAALLAAFATDKAFDAAVDTILTALETTLIACDNTLT
jgi:hypothetical protein